ncbi:hypothetical protein [Priestia endophytica]|uniref:hypothetical protein n=1 Tax=Priestia endophytica TaxID=135735 RepID=UPI000DCA819E|nr:hypothetical protein [Priestia endophytica]RAS87031.1 hypothetical protein A4R27_01455 [Priestia endophytica]
MNIHTLRSFFLFSVYSLLFYTSWHSLVFSPLISALRSTSFPFFQIVLYLAFTLGLTTSIGRKLHSFIAKNCSTKKERYKILALFGVIHITVLTVYISMLF